MPAGSSRGERLDPCGRPLRSEVVDPPGKTRRHRRGSGISMSSASSSLVNGAEMNLKAIASAITSSIPENAIGIDGGER